MTEENRNLTPKELFDGLVKLFTDAMITAEDIKALKSDNKFNKKKNPDGIPADEVALIVESAKIEANANFEEIVAKQSAVRAKYEELTGYNS